MGKCRVIGFVLFLAILALCFSARASAGTYADRFMTLWTNIHANNLSPQGIPYHSVEPLIVEAVDYGHDATSESISELIWLDTVYAKLSGNWTPFKNAWSVIDTYYIPSTTENWSTYNPSKVASFCPEYRNPTNYPAPVDAGAPVGSDPIYSSLTAKWGSTTYLLHWLIDADNWRKFGSSGPVLINTFQRGPNEGVWKTIAQVEYDSNLPGNRSMYDVYVQSTAPQWRYTSAPDAEARIIQAMYLANLWAGQQGVDISVYTNKTAKMGDWLRYSLFDKYFRVIGQTATAGSGYNSCHYLISWYTSWGAGIGSGQNWAWRIGCHSAHIGYQNPMAAYFLSTAFGQTDWGTSLQRQLELAKFVQSVEGAFGGGVANHIAGETPYPTLTANAFHGMQFDPNPVYLDPGSNDWTGYQAWFAERLAMYYYYTGDTNAFIPLQKFMAWIKPLVNLSSDGDVSIPVGMEWYIKGTHLPYSGANPDEIPQTTTPNVDLSVQEPASTYGQDVGILGSLAKVFIWWNVATKKYGTEDTNALYLAKQILDRVWTLHKDAMGVSAPETRSDYTNFWTQVDYMPAGTTKIMPWGATIAWTNVFYQDRPSYGTTPPKGPYTTSNPAPTYNYHRTWQQCEFATANAYYDIFVANASSSSSSSSVASSTPLSSAASSTAVSSSRSSAASSVASSTAVSSSRSSVASSVAVSSSSIASSVSSSIQYQTITLPFKYDGAGDLYWQISGTINNMNSWNLDILDVNGTSFKNVYVDGSGLPAKQNGYYYIHYKGSYSYSHVEIAGTSVSVSSSSVASSIAASSSRSSVASSVAVSSSRSSVASSVASSTAVSSSRAASSVASSVASSTASSVSGGYAVNYTVNNDWGAGATCTVTIKNNTAAAVNGWTLVWTFAGNQTITQIWNATQTSSGATVTVKSLSYNATIGANGGTMSFGFNLSYSGANAKPTAFTLNGTVCTLY